MIILTIRTDKPEAEIGLFKNETQIVYETWQAHRQLAETLHIKINEILKAQDKNLEGIEGIVVYQGPGSFTGLRIGITVANTLAYSIPMAIVGETGDDWQQKGIRKLKADKNDIRVLPEYGADVHITIPKH